METFIAWVGFVGGWLLVAGPVLQASLELAEENDAREAVEAAMADAPQPAPISAWWWLVPPARLIIQKRRSSELQRLLADRLAAPELEGLIFYLDKARAWFLVGAGATLIAAKETWELIEHQEWPHWLFWVISVAMLLLAVANTVATMALSRQVLEQKQGGTTYRSRLSRSGRGRSGQQPPEQADQSAGHRQGDQTGDHG